MPVHSTEDIATDPIGVKKSLGARRGNEFGDPLKIVATAVTPVVMVSATAILIAGVNARYISVSDRVRKLAREYRAEGLSDERRSSIRMEVTIFYCRGRRPPGSPAHYLAIPDEAVEY